MAFINAITCTSDLISSAMNIYETTTLSTPKDSALQEGHVTLISHTAKVIDIIAQTCFAVLSLASNIIGIRIRSPELRMALTGIKGALDITRTITHITATREEITIYNKFHIGLVSFIRVLSMTSVVACNAPDKCFGYAETITNRGPQIADLLSHVASATARINNYSDVRNHPTVNLFKKCTYAGLKLTRRNAERLARIGNDIFLFLEGFFKTTEIPERFYENDISNLPHEAGAFSLTYILQAIPIKDKQKIICPILNKFIKQPVHHTVEKDLIVDLRSIEHLASRNIQTVEITGKTYNINSFEKKVDLDLQNSNEKLFKMFCSSKKEDVELLKSHLKEFFEALMTPSSLTEFVPQNILDSMKHNHRCPITGKSIFKISTPLNRKFPKKSYDVFYETKALNNWISTKPGQKPPQWPDAIPCNPRNTQPAKAEQIAIDDYLRDEAELGLKILMTVDQKEKKLESR